MWSTPVTFGGGMTIEKRGPGLVLVGVEVAALQPGRVPALLGDGRIVGFGELGHGR